MRDLKKEVDSSNKNHEGGDQSKYIKLEPTATIIRINVIKRSYQTKFYKGNHDYCLHPKGMFKKRADRVTNLPPTSNILIIFHTVRV